MRCTVLVALVIAVCASLSACGSSERPSSQAAAQAIIATALAQQSVHWNGWSDGVHETSDVAAHSGDQRFELDGAKVEFRVVDNVVYLRGNSAGFEPYFDLVPWLHMNRAERRRFSGRWIAIPKGDKFYARAADRVTLASLVHDETPEATPSNWVLKTVTKWSHGTKLRVLQALDPQLEIVYESLSAHAAGDRLLVGSSYFGGPGHGGVGHFSRWNEPEHVHAPSHSIPIATVRAG